MAKGGTGDVLIEIDYFGGELNAVVHKGGHIYVYALDDPAAQEFVSRMQSSGAEIIDKTVEGDYTVYGQETEYEY
jgi:hypothetical protein